MLSPQPGSGALAARPLYFFFIVDCSGSMAEGGKMQSVNEAIAQALPDMRRVASDNPNARVLVRTLRYSRGAEWVEVEPVELDRFTWQGLEADALEPGSADFDAEFRRQLTEAGAQRGTVEVALRWFNFNDLDLHVVTPAGEEIYFGHKHSACGGELDVDMNVTPTTEKPVEHVTWVNDAPEGRYRVMVNHYCNHHRPGCQDPTNWEVSIKVGETVQSFTGTISHGQPKQLVHEFTVSGGGVEGVAPAGGNTDLGAAMQLLAAQMKVEKMPDRALPPVMVLLSDGWPTDDYEAGLDELMAQPWAVKAVRLAIAIGQDADQEQLARFIGRAEIPVLQANNPAQLVEYIKWASTAVLQSTSAPASQVTTTDQPAAQPALNVPIPELPPAALDAPDSAADVW